MSNQDQMFITPLICVTGNGLHDLQKYTMKSKIRWLPPCFVTVDRTTEHENQVFILHYFCEYQWLNIIEYSNTRSTSLLVGTVILEYYVLPWSIRWKTKNLKLGFSRKTQKPNLDFENFRFLPALGDMKKRTRKKIMSYKLLYNYDWEIREMESTASSQYLE